jgi:coproporphyrinogen III oxidase-like Fe-S oxidoreductase
MGLRLCEGIDPRDYRARWNQYPTGEALRALSDARLIENDEIRLRVTAKGRLVLNAVIAALAEGD